jgi:integrase/recombinase XerD
MLSEDTNRIGQDLINPNEFPSLAHVFNSSSLDGSQGSNRENEAKCQIAASNDWQAIQTWQAAYNNSTSTARLYQMESERFLLFCVLHLKKALSSINRDDIESYHQFLGDPQPRDYWCAPRAGGRQRRGEAGWRPFAGPLSASSRATALSVIQSLFEFLVNARYLSFNPFSLIKRRLRMINNVATHFKQKQQRDIQLEEWRILLATMTSIQSLRQKNYFIKSDYG